ncbi:MAG: FAD-dependent oxidoreductase [Rhodospirillales bacterium]
MTAETVLIATGGRPSLPDIPGIEHAITSDEALDLPTAPRRIVIVGGGYIAVEFAGIFNGLGAQVTLALRGDNILRGFDEDVRRALSEEMQKAGIEIRTGAQIARIEKTGGGYALALNDGGAAEADLVMYATGRTPNTGGLGLAAAGVKTGRRGEVLVDAYSRTNIENIYAVGDVTDRMALTPVAIAEAMALTHTLYGGRAQAVDYTNVPTAVFSAPPVGTAGLTEAQAAEAAGAGGIDVYITRFRPMKHTMTGRDERTMMKLIVDKKTDRVLGAHMVGDDAPELAQMLGVALKAGATKADFDATIGVHPTAAEEFVTMAAPRK